MLVTVLDGVLIFLFFLFSETLPNAQPHNFAHVFHQVISLSSVEQTHYSRVNCMIIAKSRPFASHNQYSCENFDESHHPSNSRSPETIACQLLSNNVRFLERKLVSSKSFLWTFVCLNQ